MAQVRHSDGLFDSLVRPLTARLGFNVAIDLFCYSDLNHEACTCLITAINSQRPDLFDRAFLIGPANASDAFGKEVALEHRLQASSTFLVALNDKSQSVKLAEVANVLKHAFGPGHLVVLQDNELIR
jgi:hypothetical protein